MPMASLERYMERLPARMAELKMALADVVSLPHMKKGDQRSTMNGWMRALQFATPVRSGPVSRARLKMMGIGVRVERGDGKVVSGN